MNRLLMSNLLGLVGAAIGGVVGFYTFGWLLGYGFYGMVIPGALLGLGGGLLAGHRSTARGIVLRRGALGLSVFTEWWYLPFAADDRLTYMATHLQDLPPVKLLMMAIGTIVAFWVGREAGPRIIPRGRFPGPAEVETQRPGGGP